MTLQRYRKKRDFARTPEPRGRTGRRASRVLGFVVHKHDATRLHYDVRLEHDGVLLSWAVPKGPPLAPGEKALAIRTEDHPLEYGAFEGVIPEGEYGGGTVMLWDRGTWEPEGAPAHGLAEGKLSFRLAGAKLNGRWSLVRSAKLGRGNKEQWLMIKRSDAVGAPLVARGDDRSVATGRTMHAIAHSADRTWSSTTGERRATPRGDPLARACAALPGVRKSAQPADFRPQLATLVRAVPEGEEWLHEIKLDGYRLLAFKDGAEVKLRSRTGRDWSSVFRDVLEAVRALPVRRGILDGELVMLRPDGRSDFQALQNALDGGAGARYVYFVFDVPFCSGYDLTRVPLAARKELLAQVFAGTGAGGTLRYGDHVVGGGPHFFREACGLGLEGVVSKRADAPYVPRRTRTWLKVKCAQRAEFLVGGWTDPAGTRAHFGALLLGEKTEEGKLVYRGKVGTGFDQRKLTEIADALAPLAAERAPFVDPPRGAAGRRAHWVRPELAARISYAERTRDGILRHPTFEGLVAAKGSRTARAPREPAPARRKPTVRAVPARAARALRVGQVRMTHPERVLYPAEGITKLDVARYCAEVADFILPHVVRRPLTVVRCPAGQGSACFYQKHARPGLPEAIRSVRIRGEDEPYLWIDDLDGLTALVQFGALEIHPWGSRIDRLEHPDRVVIDLDPDPAVPWKEVVETAHALRAVLEELELRSFARTTGGKGLHVVLPIERRTSWEAAKAFTRDLVTLFTRQSPERFVLTASKARRKGRIFLDYLRNARGATAIASYCMRARPGAPVATPITWDELTPELDPARFTLATVPRRVQAPAQDPWAGFFETRQGLSRSVQAALRAALERRPAGSRRG